MIVLLAGYAHASVFSERMYCTVQIDAIQISLQQKDNFLCQDYLNAIQKSMRKTAEDMLLVQGYIQDRQDVGYRLKIRDVLRDRFIKMDTMKQNIQYSIALFENNLFTKLKKYLEKGLETYYYQLLYIQENRDEENLPPYHTSITQQLETIDGIRAATGFDALMPLAQKYLYLRKELTGKSGL